MPCTASSVTPIGPTGTWVICKAELLGTGFDDGKRRLVRAFAVRTMADDGFEAERLDLVEFVNRDLAGNGVFIVDLADIHRLNLLENGGLKVYDALP